MSYVSDYFTYEASKRIAQEDYPFYALIMAAMRQADSFNAVALMRAFPEAYEDLRIRYDAPAGLRATDSDVLKEETFGADKSTWPELR